MFLFRPSPDFLSQIPPQSVDLYFPVRVCIAVLMGLEDIGTSEAGDRRVIQGARFLNSEVWYNTHEVIACLDQFEASKPLDRQTFFEQLQASRRRIFKSWDGLPVQHIFTQLDSSNLRAQLDLSGKLSLSQTGENC